MMKQQTMPANIVLDKWQDIGFDWTGQVALADFVRLSERSVDEFVRQNNDVQITVQLSRRQQGHRSLLYLAYQIKGAMILPCDRCLNPLEIVLPKQFGIYVLTDESQIDLLADEDFILMSELGGDGRLLPIKDILEDELILSLPTAVYHEDCQMTVAFVQNEKDNPFAVLSALREKLA